MCYQVAHKAFYPKLKAKYIHSQLSMKPCWLWCKYPYTVALVKLNEGHMVTAQLTDADNSAVQIGIPVEMVTRKMRNDGDERGLIVYGYMFRMAVAISQ